jgi:Cu(I)/Ag(I) efflux system membrane fusion protein
MTGAKKVPVRALLTVAAIVAAAGLVYAVSEPLMRWFTGANDEPSGRTGSDHAQHDAPTKPATPAVAHAHYPQPALDALRAAMDAADRVRALLAQDRDARLPDEARALAEALRAAASALEGDGEAAGHARTAAAAAERVASAATIEDARTAFAEQSAALIAVVGRDARLRDGWYVFQCPMFENQARWLARTPAVENPYMGTRMLACGSQVGWGDEEDEGHAPPADPSEIAHYTCPMHPSVRQKTPGQCPICGMDLTPVTKQQQQQGQVTIPPARQQLIGVRTAPVVHARMVDSIRAVGRLTYDETKLVDVNLKVRGWITKLLVNETGQRVRKGQPLFTLYSPELHNAQQELLLALRSQPLVQGQQGPGAVAPLARAARQKLRLLDLSDAQVDAIVQKGEPMTEVTFAAPASGYVIEKNVVEGGSVEPGMRLFRIGSLSEIWIEADVYEADLAHVRVGQHAAISLDYLEGRTYEARVAYIYPALDPQTRTSRVRLELANRDLELRPGMYATVQLDSDLGMRLQVPASAVVYTGPRRLVFVSLGQGVFRPQPVQIGVESQGMYEVLSGLSAGDVVATSGVFLIAAEARISTAARYWESSEGTDVTAEPLRAPGAQ